MNPGQLLCNQNCKVAPIWLPSKPGTALHCAFSLSTINQVRKRIIKSTRDPNLLLVGASTLRPVSSKSLSSQSR